MIINKYSLKIFILCLLFLSINLNKVYSQIAIQSFETSGDTWTPITLSTPACTNGSDIWDYSTSIGSISPSHLNQFWGIRDLNGNCGGSGFETISLPDVDISLYTGVTFSFDYNVVGFDNGDDLKYQLFYDNIAQSEVVIVNGSSNYSTSGWVTETVNIPNTVSNVRVVLSAKQNGGSDYGGFDNIKLEGTSSCTPPVISNVSPTSAPIGSNVTITASSGNLTGASVLFNGVSANIVSSNTTTIVCTVPAGATSGDLTITDSQPCNAIYSTFTVTCGATTEPTTPSSGLNFTNINCQDFTINWNNGNGANRIVVVSSSAITGIPTDQVNYTADAIFGNGSTLNAGEYIVYNGNGNSVTVSGLSINTNYYISIFEYNGNTINCTENYLTSTILSGTQSTNVSCPTCPKINSILVNACGVSTNEGRDEYVVFKNGSSTLDVSDIRIDFPSAGSYCNTTCGTKTIINNSTYINTLNATAGCTKFVYSANIPANATVMLFTGLSPSFAYDFSSLCSNNEVIYTLFCNNTSGSGRYANSSNSNRTTTMNWGGGCSQSVSFYSSSANTGTDGDYAVFDNSGNVSYQNDGACIAQALALELIYFNLIKNKKNIKLEWSLFSETIINNYKIYKSYDGINYTLLKTINAFEKGYNIYTINDNDNLNNKIIYYRLDAEKNDKTEILGYNKVIINNENTFINKTEYGYDIIHKDIINGEIKVLNSNGNVIYNVKTNSNKTKLYSKNLPSGIYLIKIEGIHTNWVGKIVVL